MTPWSKVAQIDASRFDDNTAFVAVNRFRLDDLRPYVYVTRDGGATWKLAVDGLPDQPVNAVRQDPVEPRLLYAATENGVSVSFDGGARWQSLQLDLPHTSVRDLIVHGNDVVVATHGRGFWILDDVEPLRELARVSRLASARSHLFTPALAYRVRRSTNTDTPLPPEEPTGRESARRRDHRLRARARRRSASSSRSSTAPATSCAATRATTSRRRRFQHLDKPAYWERPFARPSTGAGMHRFVWDLREAPPRSLQQDLPISAVPHDTPRVPEGVLVVPGRYTVRLDVDGRTVERPLVVAMDPRVAISRARARATVSPRPRDRRDHGPQLRRHAAAKRAGHESAADASLRSTPTRNRFWIRSRAPTRRRRSRR